MILCSGEALIDMLPRDSVDGEPAFAPYTGGAVFNTAIALSRLGAPTGFFSGLSTDLFGDMLTAGLDASGVSSDLAVRSSQPTTLAFVVLVNGQASYLFYDENSAGRMLHPEDIPTLSDDIDAVFFGGISLVVEPCATAYEALMTQAAPSRVTMIDPNIRTSFIKDEQVYRDRIGRMIALADIVKLSDEDLKWLAGIDDIDRAANDLLAAGPNLICITRGAEGVSGYSPLGRTDVAASRVTVVDTVGAGDTFNAGVLAALSEADVLTKEKIASLDEDTIIAALSMGSRAAAITVSRAGANPPTRDEI